MLYVGIDPGQKGGIVAVNKYGLVAYKAPMPNIHDLPKTLETLKITHVCLEHAQTFPHDSKPRAFNYGIHFGQLQGVMIAMGIKFTLVKPQVWQKVMICSPRYQDTKRRALVSANKVFKKNKSFWLATKRSTKPHDGIIDAALIARYCRLLYLD